MSRSTRGCRCVQPCQIEPCQSWMGACPAEMAPGVIILPDRRIPLAPKIGIVVGRDLVLVVDCALRPESGRSFFKLARRLAPGRRVVLTVTHAHTEHGFGAQAFKPERRSTTMPRSAIITHDPVRRCCTVPAPSCRRNTSMSSMESFSPHPIKPTTATARRLTSVGGDLSFGLGAPRTARVIRSYTCRRSGSCSSGTRSRSACSNHAVLLADDPCDDINVARWEVVLNDVSALQPHLIVPDHGNLGGLEIATNLLGLFKQARRVFGTTGVPGFELDQRLRAKNPTWEHSGYIEPAQQYSHGFPFEAWAAAARRLEGGCLSPDGGEKVSGATRGHSEFARLLDPTREDDVVVVIRLDQPARSTKGLLDAEFERALIQQQTSIGRVKVSLRARPRQRSGCHGGFRRGPLPVPWEQLVPS